MFKTLFMLLTGIVCGLILTENAQLIRHSVPNGSYGSGNINQFIFIFGVGNSSNTFKISIGDDTEEDKEETNNE